MYRRTLLGGAAVTALAGCLGTGGDSGNGTDDDDTGDGGSGVDLPELAGTFDDFEDLSPWTAIGGTVSADPQRSVVGSQSVRFDLEPGGGSISLRRSLDDPIDVSAVVPGIAIECDDVVVPWVRLFDEFGETATYRRAIMPNVPLQRLNFGVDAIDPGFDPTAVSEIDIRVAGGSDRTVWVDDLHFVPRPQGGRVMIQFDDCHVTDYTVALPMLEEHGIPAATFVNPNYIEIGDVGGDTRLSVDQCHELQDAGWTVANHTWSHEELPSLSPAEQEEEIVRGKEWLENRGFHGARYFAYPFGAHDGTTVDLVRQHQALSYHGGYPAGGFSATTELASRMGEPAADEIGDILDLTAEQNGITCYFYHRLEEAEHVEMFETMLDHLLPMLDDGELEVILPEDVEERYLF